VHAGEFLRLLRERAPDEQKFYDEGAQEVEEEIEKLGKGWPSQPHHRLPVSSTARA
jgi:rubrerythrin